MSSHSGYWPLHFPCWISRGFPAADSRLARPHVARGHHHHLVAWPPSKAAPKYSATEREDRIEATALIS
jgi:hypothetical protein